jgi:hypothetical protein
MHTKFWLENPKGRYHYKDKEVDRKIILDWILGKYGGNVWIGFIWLRIRISGGLFRTPVE